MVCAAGARAAKCSGVQALVTKNTGKEKHMVFSSTVFLFLFLPAVLLSYFIIPSKYRLARNFILLAYSIIFYFYGEQMATLVIITSIIGNYIFALWLSRMDESKVRLKNIILSLSITYNLGILFYFKYTNFFINNINRIISDPISIQQIIMPIGISFFTFQGMSYVFDVYRGLPVQKNILNVALYISLFPQLVAGPIVRYETIQSELLNRRESPEQNYNGLNRFIIGLGKKMILANTMGEVASSIFATDFNIMTPGLAWIGAIAYAFQIFYDFSAYSDMAIGLGLVFGFHFLENFNYPYISRSITEFWRRWHISLSTWFRDYVYIPLGGNRKGIRRQIVNIFIVWALTGFWHGAAWNFILWGLYYAVLLTIEKLFLGRLLDKAWRPLAHMYSVFFIVIGWVIFNSEGLSNMFEYLKMMFDFKNDNMIVPGYSWYYITQYKIEFGLCLLFSTPIARNIALRYSEVPAFQIFQSIAVVAIFIISIAYVVGTSFNPFIYFRF